MTLSRGSHVMQLWRLRGEDELKRLARLTPQLARVLALGALEHREQMGVYKLRTPRRGNQLSYGADRSTVGLGHASSNSSSDPKRSRTASSTAANPAPNLPTRTLVAAR